MKKTLLLGILSLAGAGRLLAATSLYINDATVLWTDPIPPIDATAFVNLSDMQLSIYSLGDPFEITSLRNFTNFGTMVGTPGFLFQFRTNSAATPRPLSSFENHGIISSSFDLYATGTNLFSDGILASGNRGYILLQSSIPQANTNGVVTNYTGKINLAGSGLQTGWIPDLEALHTGRRVTGKYTNDVGVSDLYWGVGLNNIPGNTDVAPSTLALDFGTYPPVTPSHQVTQIYPGPSTLTWDPSLPACGGNNFSAWDQITLLGAGGSGSETSVVQVVYVNTNALFTNLQVQVGFVVTNTARANSGWTSVVQFAVSDVSIADGSPITNYLYLLDSALSAGNPAPLSQNQVMTATLRPANYELIRAADPFLTAPWEWIVATLAQPTNEPFLDPTFYARPGTGAQRVPVTYSGYAAWLGQTNWPWNTSQAVADPTNYPGKVEILANRLDANGTRIRSDNFVGITARNLEGDPVPILPQLDAPFVNIDVATTNPVLLVSNSFPANASVVRLWGQIAAYSATWNHLTTNYVPIVGTTNRLTNYYSTLYHVLVVDNCLDRQPVALNKFVAHGKHLDIDDPLNIPLNGSMLLDAQSLTVGPNDGGLSLPPGWSWGSTNVQGLRSLTNFGSIFVPRDANFWITNFSVTISNYVVGLQTNHIPIATNSFEQSYLNFVNHGGVSANKVEVRSSYFENTATPNAQAIVRSFNGVLKVDAQEGVVTNSQLLANTKLSIFANNLLVRDSLLMAGTNSASGGFIELSVTNNLTDGVTNAAAQGVSNAVNQWVVSQGITVDRLPAQGGSLLGTVIYSKPAILSATHSWPGRDLGRTAAGFQNNLALGKLILDSSSAASLTFQGPDTTNQYALYVDFLDLRGWVLNNFLTALKFPNTNFTIYFANSSVPPQTLNNIYLNRGGRLKWVYSYAGLFSSTNFTYVVTNAYGVVSNTYAFNVGLVQSPDLYSNGGGPPNADNPHPVFAPLDVALDITELPGVPPKSVFSWWALADSTNRIEYATNLTAPQWTLLTNSFFVNGTNTTRVSFTNTADGGFRIYRVREDPRSLLP